MKLEWSSSLATGVPELDEQHMMLFDVLNDLGDAVEEGRSSEKVADILEFVGQYAQKHFMYEESCFEEYNCPFAARNKSAHEVFVATFTDLTREYYEQGESTLLAIRIYRELTSWLIGHISRVDTRLHPCVRVAGAHAELVPGT